ncbi:MAG: glycosyltransferase family 4 protein [Actinomycetota bacterium]|nr:glycosyltransferase family 4 protein [Actinomycetota bacterium]
MTPISRQPSDACGALPCGFNVFGYLTSNLGLGVAARTTARMLVDAGHAVRLDDVDPGGGMQGRDVSFAKEIARTRDAGPFAVNLFHINPDQALYLLGPGSERVRVADTLQVCVPFWELPRVPASWIEPLHAMDIIMAPTRYVADAVRADIPDARIVPFPQTVHLPEGIRPDRPAFDLAADEVVFVMSFDMRSDMERKNPWVVVRAFSEAFPDRSDVRLIIKVNNVDTLPGLERHVTRLRETAADERITVIDRSMPYAEVLSLYASCDVLVSLHRAEGLGLSLLEGMALGLPVIGTAFSGNMDFMTEENSCLVGYDPVEVSSSTQPAYGRAISGEQMWAEPRLSEAVRWMRALADDPALRARIGAHASETAQRTQAEHRSGRAFEPVLTAAQELVAGESTVAQQRMSRLARRYPLNMGRRIVRAAWHRLKTRLGA